MSAPGFCTCRRDFPGIEQFHPPAGATWHYLCDKPTVPPFTDGQDTASMKASAWGRMVERQRARTRPTGTGWPS